MSIIYDPQYKIIVNCLKNYRIQSNMTQQELASALGCSQGYVSKYEQGQKRLDIIEIRNICLCLGVPFLSFVTDFEQCLKEEEK